VLDTKSFGLVGHYATEEMVAEDVSAHYTDMPIGRDFFHDVYRMHKDALADGAKKALDKIFGPEAAAEAESEDSDEDSGDNAVLIWKTVSIALLILLVIAVSLSLWLFCKAYAYPDKQEAHSRGESKIETINAMRHSP
jgi:hypothetical protein